MKNYKYSGVLAAKRQTEISNANIEERRALKVAREAELEGLIFALFADCDAGAFDPADDRGLGGVQRGWRQVALALAERHVPGFQIGRGRGRPRAPFDKKLLSDVREVLKRQRTPSKGAAARSVAAKYLRSAAGVERKMRRYKNDK